MTPRVLLIEVGLLDERWHGVGDWPPSPFRLFQALVAGAYGGRWIAEDASEKDDAFRWLEALRPPRIAAPAQRKGRVVTHFVPNNDLDAVGGDPDRVSEIRSAKAIAPRLLGDGPSTFLYAWAFDQGDGHAARLCGYAERLHTFGRGVDATFARAEVLDPPAADTRLAEHGGTVSRPTMDVGGSSLTPCPAMGSLDSLKVRHAATATRLQEQVQGRRISILFRQPPKAYFSPVAYDSPSARLHYDLRAADDPGRFRPVPQARALALAEAVRDGAALRLTTALADRAADVERVLVGHGATAADVARRVRIIPLPTIGHAYASPSIRRVAVEVPPDCPIRSRDLAWALTGVRLAGFDSVDPETGEVVAETVLSPADDHAMAERYGFGGSPARRWRSVTPVALPRTPGRARTGSERVAAEADAGRALASALRHAGVEAQPMELRIQREPFHGKGAPADTFEGGRFVGRLRHLEVLFDRPVAGPLVLGDGRFLGLGLMRPVREAAPGLHLFAIDPATAPPVERHEPVARALRRAVMALAQRAVGRHPLPRLFSGHEPDGAPARSGRHEHLFHAAWASEGGARIDRLAIIAPHLADRTAGRGRDDLEVLATCLADLRTLRAGPDGVLELTPLPPESSTDAVLAAGRVWTSLTPYRPTRYPTRRQTPEAAVAEDLLAECARRGLPRPEVTVKALDRGPRGGLACKLQLTFAVEVVGPLLLGRGSHFGEGLFRREAPAT